MSEDFFSKVEDKKAVRITLPVTGEEQYERLQCVYGADTPPCFLLYFPDTFLGNLSLQTEKNSVVTVDIAGQAFSVHATISEIIDDHTLKMEAQAVTSHEQERNYFRVDANAPVIATPILSKQKVSDNDSWVLEGETLDLSGSGALCSFPQPLEQGKKIRIALMLPTGLMEEIHIIGSVVRCRKIHDELYHIGLHFDALTSEDRDKIMASCFELQRKHLRMKVQVQNTQ